MNVSIVHCDWEGIFFFNKKKVKSLVLYRLGLRHQAEMANRYLNEYVVLGGD